VIPRTLGYVLVGLTLVLLLTAQESSCGGETSGEEDDPVVVRGHLLDVPPAYRYGAVVELHYGGSDPTNCEPVPPRVSCSFSYEDEVGPDGGFILRASPTSEMEEEQERTGVVRFYVAAYYGKGEFFTFDEIVRCSRWEELRVRFVDGRWSAPDRDGPPTSISIDEGSSGGRCIVG
jgi:hypothetical protein